MTLYRRCDGCGQDLTGFSGEYYTVRVPAMLGIGHDYDFHGTECIAAWLAKVHEAGANR